MRGLIPAEVCPIAAYFLFLRCNILHDLFVYFLFIFSFLLVISFVPLFMYLFILVCVTAVYWVAVPGKNLTSAMISLSLSRSSMHDVEGFLGWALLTLQWRVVQHFRLFSQNCFVPLSYQMIMKHQSPFAVSVFLSFLHSGIDTFGSLDFYIYYYWFGFIGYLSFCIVWLLFMCLWMFLLIVLLHIFYRCIFHSYGLLLFVLWFILGLFSVLFSLDFCKCNDFCFACLFISCCFFNGKIHLTFSPFLFI